MSSPDEGADPEDSRLKGRVAEGDRTPQAWSLDVRANTRRLSRGNPNNPRGAPLGTTLPAPPLRG